MDGEDLPVFESHIREKAFVSSEQCTFDKWWKFQISSSPMYTPHKDR